MTTKKRVAIIASGGGLDTAYKVLNIATAAAAMEAEAAVFFTFDGLSIIHKKAADKLQLAPHQARLEAGFKNSNIPSVPELLAIARESGVKLIACQMTMDIAGMDVTDFIDGVEVGGAALFLDFAYDADVTLSF